MHGPGGEAWESQFEEGGADLRPVRAAEVIAHALEHTEGPLENWWLEERWSFGCVTVARLRTAHAEFRREVPLRKHELMSGVLERHRRAILEGNFPEATRILIGGTLPAVVLLRDGAGELFVMDGQCRVLTALWHGFEKIEVYVFDETRRRPLPDPGR